MILSPLAVSFVPRSNVDLFSRNSCICKAFESLSDYDFRLFSSIRDEWESSPTLKTCFLKWSDVLTSPRTTTKSLHVISFNVRGFDLRWQEVLLLTTSYETDILILLETGDVDLSTAQLAFNQFHIFVQKGENKNGGVLIMVRENLRVHRIDCSLPNVCIVDCVDNDALRIIGLYAPASRTWDWDQLSAFITESCVLFGDFNVDLERDREKSDKLLRWADSHSLAPFVPSTPTSRRSDRVIDYAFSNGPAVLLLAHACNTTSDHLPIISSVQIDAGKEGMGKSTRWRVFQSFSEFTAAFWNEQWKCSDIDSTYESYIRFLRLLEARCTFQFPLKKYRTAIPPQLRSFLSYVRALSFRQMRTQCLELKAVVKNLRKLAKQELQSFVASQFDATFQQRHSAKMSVSFWSKAKRHIKPAHANIQALVSKEGAVIKDPKSMCDMAAQHYTELFREAENIVRPHPYTDAPCAEFDHMNEAIPKVSLEELTTTVNSIKKKKSKDAHGLSSFLLASVHASHWKFLLDLYNRSFAEAVFPVAWKDTRIILLAKKAHICEPAQTRPISLLDTFQKIGEKLFLSRFRKVLERRGLLPHNQSGFREKHRLQTRVLLFLDELYSLLANSSPIATVFVDFKRAFDMLWHEGCAGKLLRLGIPEAYTTWIYRWLINRRAYIEIGNSRSEWFRIGKGGPQGGILTPTLFISYHADMPTFLSRISSHYFADDLAAIMAGNIGSKYSAQCIELERRVKVFLDQLEFYCTLAGQPINFSKCEALWSARAIGRPAFEIQYEGKSLEWAKGFKYLGYWICPKLGWSKSIQSTKLLVRQRIAKIGSFKLFGRSNCALRKALFDSYVLPLFTWLLPVFPLFSNQQRADLNHFYFSCIKRIRNCRGWNDELVSFAFEDPPLNDRCSKYWDKYLEHLADSEDGELLLERMNWNVWRKLWLDRELQIKGINRSKRFVEHKSILEAALQWRSAQPAAHSIPDYDWDDVEALRHFPETFLTD